VDDGLLVKVYAAAFEREPLKHNRLTRPIDDDTLSYLTQFIAKMLQTHKEQQGVIVERLIADIRRL
jgi:hypothetical protein